MILLVHTDAYYLSKAGGKSRAAGHFYLTNQNNKNFINGAVLTLSAIIKHVMSSASKVELSPLYYSCKMAAPLRTTLNKLGHNQANPTPITTNNINAQGLTMGIMTAKASKSMDQRFHWLKCRDAQCQFKYLWQKASSTKPTMPANTMLPNITSMWDPSMSLIVMPHWPNDDLSKHYSQVCFPNCKGVLNIHISKLDTYLYPSRQLHLPGYYYLLCSIPLLIAITLVNSLPP
jgi:hypothetical protein